MTKRRASSVPCRRRGYPGGWCADPQCRQSGKCIAARYITAAFKKFKRACEKAARS